MIVTNLYLITCVKDYPAFTGDSCSEVVKLLVPANSKTEAEEYIIKNRVKFGIDRISGSKFLYELSEGCGYDSNGNWSVFNGFDSDKIYKV